MGLKHDELQNDLANHLLSPERMVWQNMQIGPAGSPRPDVYTINKSYSKPNPLAYEIKVSKSDFLSDMKSGKWQSYLQFSSAVIFCVPEGLVTKNDIPAGCGLMVRGDNGWRTLKAPRIERCNIPINSMMKLLIDGVERHQKAQIKQLKSDWQLYDSARKRFGGVVADVLKDHEHFSNCLKYEQSRLEYRQRETEKQCKQELQYAKDQAERLLYLKGELASALGLQEGANIWEIERAVRDMKNSLSESDALKQAISNLEHCQRNIGNSLEKLKQLTGQQ